MCSRWWGSSGLVAQVRVIWVGVSWPWVWIRSAGSGGSRSDPVKRDGCVLDGGGRGGICGGGGVGDVCHWAFVDEGGISRAVVVAFSLACGLVAGHVGAVE